MMTDNEIWFASLLAGTLANLAYAQALPHLETPSSWSRRTQIIVGIAIFIATGAAGRIVSNAIFGASKAALTTSRETERNLQQQGNDIEERIKAMEGR